MQTVLVRLASKGWLLDISGAVRDLPPFLPIPESHFELRGTAAELQTFSRRAQGLTIAQPGVPVEALFFENSDYDFYLNCSSPDVVLRLPPGAQFRHRSGDVSHHAINFGNDVGNVEIQVVSGAGNVKLKFVVYPSKLDYRSDYVKMRDDVSAIARNLAMTVQARTFGTASSVATPQRTLAERLSLLRALFAQFVRTANAVVEKPHFTLERIIQAADVARARRLDARALDRRFRQTIARPGGYLPNTNIVLPARVPEVLRRTTFSNAENGYFKYLLSETARNLQMVLHTDVTGDEDADLSAEQKFFAAIKPEAGEMLRQVQRILRASFLQDIPAALPKSNLSPVLFGHPNYAAFIKTARQLNGGLALRGGIFQIGVKNIALLYEYWCFLRLVRMLSDDLQLEQQSIIELRHLKIVVVLAKGREATIRFRDPISGKPAYVVYDRLFKGLPTISQRPDNVIQLASQDRLYILDAKYRLAYDADYAKKYGGGSDCR